MEKLFGSFVGYALALRQSIYNNYQGGAPQVLSWFITPMKTSSIYRKLLFPISLQLKGTRLLKKTAVASGWP